MHLSCLHRHLPAALSAMLISSLCAQSAQQKPAEGDSSAGKGTGTIAVQANLVIVPAVVSDKKSLVTSLNQSDFAISVNGKPQTIRYFDKDADVPLTVGLLVDTSRSQAAVLDDEQKGSERFLQTFLKPASATRPADKAFVLQFAHTAELLQDVTDSRPLLAASLKQIGTQAPGDTDGAASQTDSGTTDPSASGNPRTSSGGYGGYGRRSGYPGNGTGSDHGSQARGGTVLYDAMFLSSEDVLSHQKGRRALIVLTDGVDRHSKESLGEAIEAAQRADTVVYAIYYKGQERDLHERRPDDYGGYGGYGGYGRPGYPGSGGRPGSDGTYADPDGKKILQRVCGETGGRLYELRGKGGIDQVYQEIGEELRAQYRLGFTPTLETAGTGFHTVEVSLTNPGWKKAEIQTREGYYTREASHP